MVTPRSLISLSDLRSSHPRILISFSVHLRFPLSLSSLLVMKPSNAKTEKPRDLIVAEIEIEISHHIVSHRFNQNLIVFLISCVIHLIQFRFSSSL